MLQTFRENLLAWNPKRR